MGFGHSPLAGRGWGTRLLCAAIGMLATLSGCGEAGSKRSADAAPARPAVLRIGWVPNDEDVERRARWEGLRVYLERTLKLPVELVQTGSYAPAIEAMRAGKLEVCGLAPFAYLIASEKGIAEPLVAPGFSDGKPNYYRSGFIVPANSKLRSMQDVKAQARGLTLAWADPASASGHLVPRAYLETLGINPEKDFKQTLFSLNHTASIMTVKSGQVDLAVITQNTLANLVQKGRLKADDLRVIWTSAPIATSVVAVRGGLGARLKEQIQAAYLGFRTEDPVNWSKFQRLFVDPATIWVAAKDSDYDELRTLARSVKHLDLLNR